MNSARFTQASSFLFPPLPVRYLPQSSVVLSKTTTRLKVPQGCFQFDSTNLLSSPLGSSLSRQRCERRLQPALEVRKCWAKISAPVERYQQRTWPQPRTGERGGMLGSPVIPSHPDRPASSTFPVTPLQQGGRGWLVISTDKN